MSAAERVAQLPTITAEVVYYAAREAIRNAAKYGRGAASPFRLTVSLAGQAGVVLMVTDNGVGISAEGEATSSQQGSGQGLALHSTMMAVVGGTLSVDSRPGKYTKVSLFLNL